MNRFWFWGVALATVTVGCRTAPIRVATTTNPASVAVAPIAYETPVQQVGFSQELPSADNATQASIAFSENPTLQEIEQLALAGNPAVNAAIAEIESLRGKLVQAGLPPNPRVGVNGEDINEDGGAGRYGVFFGREVVRGNKLCLSRSVVDAEINAAEQRLEVVRRKLLTDIRQGFYEVLVAQEKIATIQDLVEISQNAVNASEKLFEAKEAAKTSVLQSELELQNAKVLLKQAENQKQGATRRLAALLGQEDIAIDSVNGDIRSLSQLQGFEQSYDELVNSSPEINALFAEVEQRRRNLRRQIAEPIPNVTWQTTVQFDTVTDDVVTGFQIGMPIPTLNRNQGAVHQARQQIIAAERETEKKALDLRQRLASAYQDYIDAKIQVEAFESEIIPKASETLELISLGYEQGEVPFLEWLTAQRTFSRTQLTYLNQLSNLWEKNWQVRGMLLTGSLK